MAEKEPRFPKDARIGGAGQTGGKKETTGRSGTIV